MRTYTRLATGRIALLAAAVVEDVDAAEAVIVVEDVVWVGAECPNGVPGPRADARSAA